MVTSALTITRLLDAVRNSRLRRSRRIPAPDHTAESSACPAPASKSATVPALPSAARSRHSSFVVLRPIPRHGQSSPLRLEGSRTFTDGEVTPEQTRQGVHSGFVQPRHLLKRGRSATWSSMQPGAVQQRDVKISDSRQQVADRSRRSCRGRLRLFVAKQDTARTSSLFSFQESGQRQDNRTHFVRFYPKPFAIYVKRLAAMGRNRPSNSCF